MESTSRSRSSQRDKKMLWWNLEADHQWTWILKMLNSKMLQRKLTIVILKRSQNQITMNLQKSEGDWDS